MKLKKIASLALAGIMAVSMLAGCKSNPADPETPDEPVSPSNSFTSTVLAEASDVTNTVLKASSNDRLDKAVVYAANNAYAKGGTDLAYLAETSEWVTLSKDYMTIVGVDYIDNGHNDSFVNKLNADKKDKTIYGMFYVARTRSDEWIANEVAEKLDYIATKLSADTNDYTYEYTVSVAKADSSAGDEAKRESDAVVVGIAISVDVTEVKY